VGIGYGGLDFMAVSRVRLWSSVGKKVATGLTGVLLLLFIIAHVAGNLTLFGGADSFNGYTHALHSWGWLVYVAEVGLVAVFALHAYAAVTVWVDARKARSVAYTMVRSKGGASRQTLASRGMIVTGAVLLVFTIVHVLQFRFGPAESAGYVTHVGGEPARDLHRLVVETFKSLPWVIGYTSVMIFLGFHLRHGVWSAFQSLGLLNPRLRAILYPAGLVAGALIAVAFLLMPIYIYLFVPVPPSVGLSLGPRP
jgi:succinate dehydrogenase / fumarate reductase cytochrome b subunit